VLCALYWQRIPVWLLGLSLAAVAVIAAGMGLGGSLLSRELDENSVYPWYFWAFVAALVAFAVTSLLRRNIIRSAVLPAILLLYMAFGLFLLPFDGPRGAFDAAAQDFADGKTVAAPINFGAREEIYRFLLPGSEPHPYNIKKFPGIGSLRERGEPFIVTVSLDEDPLAGSTGLRVVGTRLQLVDRFDNKQTADMFRGNVAPHIFKRDFLVEVLP